MDKAGRCNSPTAKGDKVKMANAIMTKKEKKTKANSWKALMKATKEASKKGAKVERPPFTVGLATK
jgi:hypothetical protein